MTNTDDELVEDWAENQRRSLIHDPKLPRSFNSGWWRRGYNPDIISATNRIAGCCNKIVMEPVRRSQHRPIGVQVNAAITVQTVPFRRRFNLKKANCEQYAYQLDAAVDNIPATAVENIPATAVENIPATAVENIPATAVENIPATAVENIPATAVENIPATAVENIPATAVENIPATAVENIPATAECYDQFVNGLRKVARKNIPHGCRRNYVPGLTPESTELTDMPSSVKMGLGVAESLPAGYGEDWLCWRALNRLRIGVGRSKTVMRRWGYLDDAQTFDGDCGEPQTMAHLLSCCLLDEATVTERAKACSRKWENIV